MLAVSFDWPTAYVSTCSSTSITTESTYFGGRSSAARCFERRVMMVKEQHTDAPRYTDKGTKWNVLTLKISL